MRVIRAGPRAFLVECEDQEQVFRLYTRLREDPRLEEAVPGDRTLLAIAGDSLSDAELFQELRAAETAAAAGPAARPPRGAPPVPVVVEVRYDGPDVEHAAGLLGCSVPALVAAHTGSLWTVQFLGFSPGFGYLANPSAGLAVPRRESPRAKVPAGSVALGAQYSAVYPAPSPGGWQLIGSTDTPMWDPERDPPALLAPGSLVQFVAVA